MVPTNEEKTNTIKSKCEWCGEEFLHYKNIKRKFCSKECFYQYRWKDCSLTPYKTKLRQLIHDVGPVTSKEIQKELFGEINRDAGRKTAVVINCLRRDLKKEGIDFYSVKGKYQFLDEDSYLECSLQQKERWAGYTRNLQLMIKRGALKCPDLREDLVKVLGEMSMATLSYNQDLDVGNSTDTNQ